VKPDAVTGADVRDGVERIDRTHVDRAELGNDSEG
jgi:hypothetical protein